MQATSLQIVFNRYIKAISKQMNRRNRQNRDAFTPNENKAIEFYGRAAQQIEILINRGEQCQPPQ
jgi:hypothetical protein